MKCENVISKKFVASEHPELQGLVLEEDGFYNVNQRCPEDVLSDDEAAGYRFCHACLVSKNFGTGRLVQGRGSDIPKRLKIQIHVSSQKAMEFAAFETHESDSRSREERQVPQSLRQSTKVVDAKHVDVSGFMYELKSDGWYIYRVRMGKKQTGFVLEVSLAQRGYSKPPVALSRDAMEAVSDEFIWPSYVRVYRNTGYLHAEHGDIGLHSVEIVRVDVGANCTSRLRFGNGLWPLEILECRDEEVVATPAPAANA